jgi:hypothetical protein
MTVKDILSITPNNITILLEDEAAAEYTVYQGEAYKLHGEYINAAVEWIRPIENGLALKVSKDNLTAAEVELIKAFRAADEETKAAILALYNL